MASNLEAYYWTQIIPDGWYTTYSDFQRMAWLEANRHRVTETDGVTNAIRYYRKKMGLSSSPPQLPKEPKQKEWKEPRRLRRSSAHHVGVHSGGVPGVADYGGGGERLEEVIAEALDHRFMLPDCPIVDESIGI